LEAPAPELGLEPPFVSHESGQPPHPTTLQKTFIAARKDAALAKHATIHSLRHSYATHLLESGVTIATIQKLLGHSAMNTTMVYMHVTQTSGAHVQDVVDRLLADLPDVSEP
jgi:site-specific recombinase XerD